VQLQNIFKQFLDSQDSGFPPHKIVENYKFELYIRRWDQYASSCQISSKSMKRLQRYGGLTVFKMAAVRHLDFLKLKFFTV